MYIALMLVMKVTESQLRLLVLVHFLHWWCTSMMHYVFPEGSQLGTL